MRTSVSEIKADPAFAVANLCRLVVNPGLPEGTLIAVTTAAWDRLLNCALMNGTPTVSGSGAIVTGPVVQLITELVLSNELVLLKSNPSNQATPSTTGPEKS